MIVRLIKVLHVNFSGFICAITVFLHLAGNLFIMTLRRLFIPILLLTVTNLYSQNHLKDYTYKISDSCWRIAYYMPLGPLSRMESYKDKKKTIAHGRFAFYDERGWTDSTGFFADGLRDGTWYYYANNGKLYLSREYSEGKMVSEKY